MQKIGKSSDGNPQQGETSMNTQCKAQIAFTRRGTLLTATSFAAALALASTVTMAQAQQPASEEVQLIAQEAYIYLYPLITMDLTRKQLINLDPKVNPL